MRHLTEEQLEELKKILLSWQDEILNHTKEALEDGLKYEGGDDIDRARTENLRLLKLRDLDRNRKVLKRIEMTLLKFEYGTYGICERCGAEIPYERLKARPIAKLCIKCKIEEEEEED
jgi:DnaK suppressor protein